MFILGNTFLIFMRTWVTWDVWIGRELDPKVRDAFHLYIEARGINESLFPFLQAWLYVKDHRKLMKWFKTVGTFISDRIQAWGDFIVLLLLFKIKYKKVFQNGELCSSSDLFHQLFFCA